MTPVVAAYAPFALVVGTAVATSADPWSAWAGTWLVYGGAAQVAVSSTTQADIPMVLGLVVAMAAIVVIVYLAIDLLQGWLNPKVRV